MDNIFTLRVGWSGSWELVQKQCLHLCVWNRVVLGSCVGWSGSWELCGMEWFLGVSSIGSCAIAVCGWDGVVLGSWFNSSVYT